MSQSFNKLVKITLVLLLSISSNSFLFAQNSGGIFFQAVARDSYSNPAKDRKIYVVTSILQTSATGTAVLTELHQTTTDGTGMFGISIGQGTRTGGTAANLQAIDWPNGPYYLNLKVAIEPFAPVAGWDYKAELVDLGTTAFGTVPYALYSIGTAGMSQKLNIADSTKYVTPAQLAAKTFDQTPLLNSIATKLNIADSLTKYVTPAQLDAKTFDQAPINAAIATKANTTDVSAALATKENVDNKSTDVAADGTSDTKYPSVKSIKNYVDASITANTTPLSFSAPLSKSGFTVSLGQANGSNNGYLSSSDWTSFNNKIDATQKAAVNGVATLGNDGKIPSNQIPAISFQSATVVNSQANMLAIPGAVVGSIAIRTDNNKNYVLSASPSTTLANWIELATPNSVTSVNGFAGPNVTLTTNDVNEGATNKYYTDARARGALSVSAPLVYNSSTGAFSIPQASTTADGFLSATDWNKFNGAEPASNKSNDIAADAASTTKFPTVKSIKDYVDLQSANAGVADNSITSAKINGTIAILKGGTGASTAAGARTNLGLVIGTDVMAANATTTLTGDVTGSGNGSFATTVNSVGGISAATIAGLPTSVSSNTASITLNTNSIATNTADILLKAPLASPAFTGTPSAPTPATSDNSTTLATTAYVKNSITAANAGLSSIGAISGTSNANGATISGTTQLILTPADGTNGGVVTTGTQTFAGSKTFSNTATFNSDITLNGIRAGRGNGAVPTNTVFGFESLNSNSTGYNNTAIGYNALKANNSYANIAVGYESGLYSNGYGNIFIGEGAGNFASTSGGGVQNSGGVNSVYIGRLTGPMGNNENNEIVIAGFSNSQPTKTWGLGTNTTLIGNAYVMKSQISGALTVVPNAATATSGPGGTGNGNSSTIAAQNGFTNSNGGALNLTAGNGNGSGNGGDININPGLKGTTGVSGTVKVNGQIQITGGTPGLDKVLTSDANGLATWNSLPVSVTNLSTIGTTANANGATISGTTLNLEPASASFGGIVTTGAQTFAGAKTFNSDIAATNFLGNATTATTAGNITATSNTTLTSLSNLNTVGTITSGTWSGSVIGSNMGGAGSVNGIMKADGSGVVTAIDAAPLTGQFLTSAAGGTFTWTSSSAVTGNFVPYTGATGAVDLGAYDLKVNGLTIGKGNNYVSTNLAFGFDALKTNNSASGYNTAVGYESLTANTASQNNTALGYRTLYTFNGMNSTIGYGNNTAIGSNALYKSTSNAAYNTAIGSSAVYNNTSGSYNVGIGPSSLANNSTGRDNISIGYNSGSKYGSGTGTNLSNINKGILIGSDARALTDNSINEVAIGYNVLGNGSNTVTIGNASNTATYFTGDINLTGNINGGTWSATEIAITKGGTGATTAAGALANLGAEASANKSTDITADAASTTKYPSVKTIKDYVDTRVASAAVADGSLTNAKLVNSTTTLGTTTMTLGGTVTSVTGLSTLSATNLTGALTGNASTATALANGRTISTTGDVAYTSGSFDGTTNVTGTATLTNTSVTAGTYGSSTAIPTFTVDSKGRLTAASTVGITAGVSSLNYTSTTSYAAGGTISGTSLTLTAADANNPGLVSTSAQTFAGSKTFGSDVVVNGMTIGKGGGNILNNTAIGYNALTSNLAGGTPGINNTAIGYNSLSSNTTGGNNVAIGNSAGSVNVGGSNNVFIGNNANAASGLVNNANAIAIGSNAIVDAPNKIQLGDQNITAVNTSGVITASGFIGSLTGNASTATTATTAGNITATSNTTLTSLANLATVGTITSGTWSATEIAIAKGGTGATTASGARTNLGLGSIATKSTIADADVDANAAIAFSKLNITKANITGLGIQDGLTAGSGISISSSTISVTGLTTSNLASNAAITNSQLANSTTTLGSTTMTLGGTVTSVTGLTSLAATNLTGTLTGNASTATKLAATKNINGVAFDGSADITIAADANTLTGTTLASNVVNSSLTSVGTITSGVWSGTAITIAKGGTGATTKTAAFDALSPMTTSGDIIYGGSSGTGTRLAKGTDGQLLTLASGVPAWTTLSAVTSLGTFTTTTTYANGGTISGSTLTLGAADGTNPGLVSTLAQTIAGSKTFSSDIITNEVRVGKGVAGNTSNTVLGKSALTATSTVTNENILNTAIGVSAMQNASGTGSYNTAVGANSGFWNSSGTDNTNLGYQSGYNTTTGSKNIAIGSKAMLGVAGNYLTGAGNNAIGFEAMKDISTTAADNIALGLSAGTKLTTGTKNIFIGSLAGSNISTGSTANTTGLNSVMIGYDVRPLANADNNEIVLSGYNGTAGTVGLGSNSTSIGSSTTTKTRIYGSLTTVPGTTSTANGESSVIQAQDATGIAFKGGSVSLIAGSSSSAANGGDINLTAGAGASNMTGGNINLTPGSGGVTGSVKIVGADLFIYDNSFRVGKGSGFLSANTALGNSVLGSNTTGNSNTAIGSGAMYYNTTGSSNTAVGSSALSANTTGGANTALGQNALNKNTTGTDNIGIGSNALGNNTTGSYNIGIGSLANGEVSSANTNNIGIGWYALRYNNADRNIALGYAAGGGLGYSSSTAGANNIFLGFSAGYNAGSASTINTTGANSVLIGYDVRPAAIGETNEIVISGYNGTAGTVGQGSNTTSIGNANTTKSVIYGSILSNLPAVSTTGSGGDFTIEAQDAIATGNTNGGNINLTPGNSNGTGTPGKVNVNSVINVAAGTAAASVNGLSSAITAQNGGTGNTNGGNISLTAGTPSGTGAGGNITLTPGAFSGTASSTSGYVNIPMGTTSANWGVNVSGSVDDFLEYNIKNNSTGTKAQSGFNAMANNGSDITNFVWMGINNSAFNTPTAYNIGVGNDVSFLGAGQDMYIANANNKASIIFSTGKAASPYFDERMRITNSGTLAIGTTGATAVDTVNAKLHVAGKVKIVDGNQAVTKVLTSDANGVATWQNNGGSVTTMSATGTATTTANYIIFTGSTASQIITIPSAVTVGAGRQITIKNVASVTVSIASAGGYLIQDYSTLTATSASLGIEPSNNWLKLTSDGTNWYIIRALF